MKKLIGKYGVIINSFSNVEKNHLVIYAALQLAPEIEHFNMAYDDIKEISEKNPSSSVQRSHMMELIMDMRMFAKKKRNYAGKYAGGYFFILIALLFINLPIYMYPLLMDGIFFGMLPVIIYGKLIKDRTFPAMIKKMHTKYNVGLLGMKYIGYLMVMG